LIPWGILLLLQGTPFGGWGLLVLYALISVTRTILEPRFLGRQIGLHPLLTLLALYAGFRLFGFWGMLLLPVGVMLLKQLYDLSSG
jgi:predicted PurR-regulated permease PerM